MSGSDRERKEQEHEKDQDHQIKEFVKLGLEVYKQLAILSAAAFLVILVVYREAIVTSTQLRLPLFLFGVTVVVCVVRMEYSTRYFMPTRTVRSVASHDQRLSMWLTTASAFFCAGIAALAVYLLDMPSWVGLVATIAVIGIWQSWRSWEFSE